MDLSAFRQAQRVRLSKRLLKISQSRSPLVRSTYRSARGAVRDTANALTDRQLGWSASLRSARWVGASTFEIAGWAYERGYGHVDGPPTTEVWLESGRHRVHATVKSRSDPEVNGAARNAEFDYANTAFTARFELDQLREWVDDPAVVAQGWVTKVRVVGAGRDRTGTLRSRYRLGSVRHLFARTFADDVQVLPTWELSQGGLRFGCRRATVTAREVSFTGRTFTAVVTSTGPVLSGALLRTGPLEQPLSCRRVGDRDSATPTYVVEGEVSTAVPVVPGEPPALSVSRAVLVRTVDGQTFGLSTTLDDTAPYVTPGSPLLATSGPNGTLTILDAPHRVLVDHCELETSPRLGLRLGGRYLVSADDEAADRVGEDGTVDVGSGGRPRLVFVGARQVLEVEQSFSPPADGYGTWDGFVPLLVSVWDRPALPPRIGGYVLQASNPRGERLPVSCVPTVTAATPELHALGSFRLRTQTGGGRSLRFRISAPRRADELGSFHQRRLERAYRSTRWAPRNAVYFESFYGRNATCNPRAIDLEIARHYPQLTRFWGVVDASIPVPEGSIAVVRGTREWWQARATSRYVVANDWLRRQFVPQPFQVVLQTWHGSMLKRIGLDRAGLPAAKQEIIHVERAKWDALLSQNHHSTEILESAYAWDGLMLEEGYPRNDPMSTEDGAAIRAQLGIRPDQTAILYAPTWRENQTSMVTFLDLEKLVAELGDDYVVLLRGHSRTVAFGESVALKGVVDVTTHPDITELFLAADAMITDYSSVMFDFSVTRRPMIFFVPDMDDYRDSLRGVYFDLSEVAPGPVLSTQDEVTRAIRELGSAGERYADAYDAWFERFNHHDDGHVAERVVRRLLALRK